MKQHVSAYSDAIIRFTMLAKLVVFDLHYP